MVIQTDAENKAAAVMILEGQNSWLRLRIVRYQFPEIENDEWDSNWLIVEGHVCLAGREWWFNDPCLTTSEAMWLADWLDAVVSGTAEKAHCAFTEPNLEFERASDGAVRVSFAQESAPPWSQPNYGTTEFGFDIPIGPGLAIAAEHLRMQLAQFPTRGRRQI